MKKVLIILITAIIVIPNIIPLVNFLTEPPVLMTIIIYLSFLYFDEKKAHNELREELKRRKIL